MTDLDNRSLEYHIIPIQFHRLVNANDDKERHSDKPDKQFHLQNVLRDFACQNGLRQTYQKVNKHDP